MNTNKAAYWIAAGVLALGLNSEYRQGNFVALHRIADRAGSAICGITARARKTLEVAKFLTSPEEGLPDNLVADEVDMARAHGEMLQARSRSREEATLFRDGVRDRMRDQIRAQAEVIRARAEIQRAEIEIRLRTHSPFTFANVSPRELTVFCPKAGTRIALNHVAPGSPEFEVRETF
jgi:hypothetical protein